MLRGALRLGAIAGIDIRVHWTFGILVVWVAWALIASGQGWGGAVSGIVLLVAVFACVVLHELGHALMAGRFGVATRDITLYPIGGIASLERIPEDPRQELLIALAGPAVNVVIAAALAVVIRAGAPFGGTGILPGMGGTLLGSLVLINVGIAAFNMLPAFPMDGGRVLRAGLALRMDRVQATHLAARIGQALAVGMALAGLLWSWVLVVVAAFVFIGAAHERRAVVVQAALQGATVADAMVTRFETLWVGASVGLAVDALLAGEQDDFPVVANDGTYIGMLTRASALTAARDEGRDALIARLVAEVAPAGPGDALEPHVRTLVAAGIVTRPVVVDGRVVGLLSLRRLDDWLAVRRNGIGARIAPPSEVGGGRPGRL